MANNSNYYTEKVFFQNEDVFDVISEILEKNGFKETIDDVSEMDEDTEQSKIIIISKLAEDLVLDNISEKDFCSSLQIQLKTSKKISENILKDVKEKILPFTEKIRIKEGMEEENKSLTAMPVRLMSDNQTIAERPIIKEDEIKPIENKEIKYPKEPDQYREPIE